MYSMYSRSSTAFERIALPRALPHRNSANVGRASVLGDAGLGCVVYEHICTTMMDCNSRTSYSALVAVGEEASSGRGCQNY